MLNETFIAGFDYARGGSDLNSAKGDDFSITTLRVKEDRNEFCHAYRYTGISAQQASAIIHSQHLLFRYKYIVGDPGGGGLFVRDELRKPNQDDGAKRFPVRPIITGDDLQIAGIGDPCLILFRRGDPLIDELPPRGLGLKFPSDAGIINKAHEIMKTDLEKKLLAAPPPWSGWSKSGHSFSSPDAMRKWLNRQSLTPMDRCRAEIDLTLLQLITVDRKTDKEGNPMLDSKGYFQFMSKRKKDSAYSLVYANFGVWLHRQLALFQATAAEDNRDFLCTSETVDTLASLHDIE